MTRRDASQKKKVHCANCFACFAETELCPLEPGYDEEKVFAELEKRVAGKDANNKKWKSTSKPVSE